MRRGSCLFVLAALALILAPGTSPGVMPVAAPAKTLITDGSVYHDVGNLWLNITNWDVIGSEPLSNADMADAPSALWPAPDGHDRLFWAQLWVGGVAAGERLVSTRLELEATPDPLDVIYEMARGDPGGTRYPFGDPDDDGDGLEDEDPRNGLDDDGDGLIDEDFAAISDQHFRLVMIDDTGNAQQLLPDHTPLHVEVVQQSFQWVGEELGDFIGFDFTVRNTGPAEIDGVYIGFFADFDIPADVAGGAQDDLAGYWEGMVSTADGEEPVHVAYMYDAHEGSRLEGYMGVLFLDHTTDPTGATAPIQAGVRASRIFQGGVPFALGGDPTDDAERYELLSSPILDPNVQPGKQDDYRILLSVGPFPVLAPGESVAFRAAMVAGNGLDGLLRRAALASQVYRGQRFDRDGDPGTGPDGKEYQVHWLPRSLLPVPAASGCLTAAFLPAGGAAVAEAVRVRIEARHLAVADLSVERTGPAAADRRLWTAGHLLGADGGPCGPECFRADLVDDEPGGWPRTYRLLTTAGGESGELDRIELAAPPSAPAMALAASPNPFNPRVVITYVLQGAGPARLTAHDLRGRLVATLLCGPQPAGPGRLEWDGRDDEGRSLPSGIYHLRLVQAGLSVDRPVTLVR